MEQSIAIASRRVVTREGTGPATIIVRGERVERLVPYDASVGDGVKHDYGNLVVMPGLIDPHVHINEPGRTEWEGFRTATMAAAAGGVTTLVDMPLNSSPVTTSAEALETKISASAGQLHVDCGFYGGLVSDNLNELPSLVTAGVFGIKTFLIESGIEEFPPVDPKTLDAAMAVIARSDIPLLAHAERRPVSTPTKDEGNWCEYRTFLESRPASWEVVAIDLIARLAGKHGCRAHVVHISAAEGLEVARIARKQGVPLTVETCPHYLYFDAESIERGATLLKCAPPIRNRANNRELLDALIAGEIDFVASDHSPAPASLKAIKSGNFLSAWGGIASLQLRLPVMWTLLRNRHIDFQQMTEWLTGSPADFLGISDYKGAIAPGYQADLVVWDPECSYTVDTEDLHDRHKLSPYVGSSLFGRVRATYLRGTKIYEDGVFERPCGQPIIRA